MTHLVREWNGERIFCCLPIRTAGGHDRCEIPTIVLLAPILLGSLSSHQENCSRMRYYYVTLESCMPRARSLDAIAILSFDIFISIRRELSVMHASSPHKLCLKFLEIIIISRACVATQVQFNLNLHNSDNLVSQGEFIAACSVNWYFLIHS